MEYNDGVCADLRMRRRAVRTDMFFRKEWIMMKKRLAIFAALALMLSLLCACGRQMTEEEGSSAPAGDPEAAADITPAEPEDAGEEGLKEADPLRLYGGILDRYYERIIAGGEIWDAGEGETGVVEVVGQGGGLDDVGYAVCDLGGDGIPELLIGGVTQECSGSDLYAVYAAPAGVPVLTAEGWARNRLHWLGENRFLYAGSNGAMYSMFGTYVLSEDGSVLDCEDFWFTYEKDTDQTEVGFYQNHSGIWDPAVSRELDIAEADFWQLETDLEAQIRAVELTPFSAYEPYGWMPVTAQWADQALVAGTACDTFVADTSDAAARVLFSTADGVEDLRLLALELEDVTETGAVTFSSREVYRQDALTPARPLVVEMTFYGDTIPNYGIACMDAGGTERRFVLEISGFDGALMLREADGQQMIIH